MKTAFVLLSLIFLNSCSSNPPNPDSLCPRPVVRKVYRGGLYGSQVKEETEISVVCPVAIW